MPSSLDRYACAYTGSARLAAGLGQYRATTTIVGELKRHGWLHTSVTRLPDASHYLRDERRRQVAGLIEGFAATLPEGTSPIGLPTLRKLVRR